MRYELGNMDRYSMPANGTVMAAADLNGTLILDVCENNVDKGVVASFVQICRDFGMDMQETQVTVFEQANVRL